LAPPVPVKWPPNNPPKGSKKESPKKGPQPYPGPNKGNLPRPQIPKGKTRVNWEMVGDPT